MTYDTIIIGGGPAAVAAAVYTARKKMKTLFITESFGGQSIVSDDIQNWIGEPHISGYDLAKKFEAHVRAFPDDVEIKTPELATRVEEKDGIFSVTTDKGAYEGKTVIVASGASRRKLGVPGEKEFEGKGVAYCSTCDAPLFSGKIVAVVGGGNAGLEAVVDLLPYATKIYLMEFGDTLKGDQVTQNEIKKNSKVEIILNAQSKEIVGGPTITGIVYTDRTSNEDKKLDVGGVFVEIGSIPNSDLVKGLIDLDRFGQVIIDAKHGTTSRPGVFAAGDVTDDPYKQNNISAGDAVKAALAAYGYLLKKGKEN